MNILRSAWNAAYNQLIAVVRLVAAAVCEPLSAYRADRNRRRAIAELESLPGAVLRDIGIRRDEIPVVVSSASPRRHDGLLGRRWDAEDDPSLAADDADPASSSEAV